MTGSTAQRSRPGERADRRSTAVRLRHCRRRQNCSSSGCLTQRRAARRSSHQKRFPPPRPQCKGALTRQRAFHSVSRGRSPSYPIERIVSHRLSTAERIGKSGSGRGRVATRRPRSWNISASAFVPTRRTALHHKQRVQENGGGASGKRRKRRTDEAKAKSRSGQTAAVIATATAVRVAGEMRKQHRRETAGGK